MTDFRTFVGVDVGKDFLDVHRHPDGLAFRVANSPAGICRLLKRLGAGPYAIGCEATGGYEDRLLLALGQAGRPAWCLHPADVRAFARLQGVRAKSDAIDARLIAEALVVATARRAPTRRTPIQSKIRQMATVRRRLCAAITQLKSLLSSLDDAAARAPLLALLQAHTAALKALGRDLQQAIQGDPASARMARRITTAPGAGPVLAIELIAAMPELGTLSSRQAASLVGVAPHPRQSGKTTRPGRCQAGRSNIRRVLYMATLSAIKARLHPIYPFYKRLRAAGKPFKVAIVAAMRKQIVMLNAMSKNQTDWKPENAA